MEAKATVMREKEIDKVFTRHLNSHPHHQWDSLGMFMAMAEAQAEISFKAGWNKRDKWLSPDETDRLEEARKAGIREVVEFLEKFNPSITLNQVRATNFWQAKLKEWGLK